MKTLSSRLGLLALLLCLTYSSTVLAQRKAKPERWIGLHNVYYKNKSSSSSYTSQSPNGLEFIHTYDESDKQLSLGLHYRVIKANRIYQQFEILNLDINESEFVSITRVPGQSFSTPSSGRRLEYTNIQIGYRLGKMLPVWKGLSADASIGGYPTYRRTRTTPLTSLGFPQRDTYLGFSLDIQLGLNYQVHPNINIGYSIVPVAGQWFWHEHYNNNPILTERQKIDEEIIMQTNAFDQLLDFRNISLRYVMPTETKKRKKRRRRRR